MQSWTVFSKYMYRDVACSIDLHPCNKFVSLWVNCITTGKFTHNNKEPSGMLSHNNVVACIILYSYQFPAFYRNLSDISQWLRNPKKGT